MRIANLAAMCLFMGTAANAKEPYEKLKTLTADQFTRKIEKRDDDLTTFILFSTESGYRKRQSSGGWLTGIESDLFLKAIIDKKTRKPTYLVIARAGWIGKYSIWQSASFTTPSGPQDMAVIDGASARIGSCVSLGCSYDMTIGVEVDETTLRGVATSSQPWRFRFRSSTGAEFENALPPVEAQAILEVVKLAL